MASTIKAKRRPAPKHGERIGNYGSYYTMKIARQLRGRFEKKNPGVRFEIEEVHGRARSWFEVIGYVATEATN